MTDFPCCAPVGDVSGTDPRIQILADLGVGSLRADDDDVVARAVIKALDSVDPARQALAAINEPVEQLLANPRGTSEHVIGARLDYLLTLSGVLGEAQLAKVREL